LVGTQFGLNRIEFLYRQFLVFASLATVVVFQPELRRALTDLGSHPFFTSAFEKRETIEEITDTVFEIASKGFGALIAVEREISLKPFIETGVRLDAEFSKNSRSQFSIPNCFDGGLIVHNDRMVAAACIFPYPARGSGSQPWAPPPPFGLSEESDAIIVFPGNRFPLPMAFLNAIWR
jgi:diadenylate cyclase